MKPMKDTALHSRPLFSGNLTPAGLIFMLLTSFSIHSIGIEYDIKQIGNPEFVNRAPVISQTGLAAWYAHKKGLPTEDGGTHIYAYLNDSVELITDRDFHNYSANIRPQVFNDTIIWQTTRDRFDVDQKTTWILREVPDDERDEGYHELPAFYANADLLRARGHAGDFNLTPKAMSYSGPYANFWEYGTIYIQSEAAKTNVFEYIPKAGTTNEFTRFTTNKVTLSGPFALKDKEREDIENDPYNTDIVRTAPYTTDSSGKERRRTITFNEICSWSANERKSSGSPMTNVMI